MGQFVVPFWVSFAMLGICWLLVVGIFAIGILLCLAILLSKMAPTISPKIHQEYTENTPQKYFKTPQTNPKVQFRLFLLFLDVFVGQFWGLFCMVKKNHWQA